MAMDEGAMAVMNGTVLVTGGAGYIGSHAVFALRDNGWNVVVLDDLSTGRAESLPEDVLLIKGDVSDIDCVDQVLCDHEVVGVMHFAGSIVVPESVANPLKYYKNNTAASRTLIERCVQAGIKAFVFSSTASVYGAPETLPVNEETTPAPDSPYGTSKLMTEWMLRDTAASNDFRYAALRYFNVAGADPDGRAGQCSENATHLIKVACETVVGKREGMSIFGDDYPTPDGTCVRDYIHVSDLATAHVLALNYLLKSEQNLVANCGYGHGYSVREVLAAVEELVGEPLSVQIAPRRAGDVSAVVADTSLVHERLDWQPRYDDLKTIISSALAWERKLWGSQGE